MSFSINNLGMYNATTSATNTAADKLTSELSNIENSSDEQLMDVCKQFETYFIEQVFKSMKNTVMKDKESVEDSGYMSYFGDMLTQKYAENATEQGGYGLAQMLYESMKRDKLV